MADPEELVGRAAVRVGMTVRRAASASQPAVHALLHHLAAENVLAPDVLGSDSQGREVLGWMAGESGQTAEGTIRPEVQTDDVLAQMAQQLRRVHDATATFRGEHLDWNPLLKDPASSVEVVCHNDVILFQLDFRRRKTHCLH